jgi:hypothetical protein
MTYCKVKPTSVGCKTGISVAIQARANASIKLVARPSVSEADPQTGAAKIPISPSSAAIRPAVDGVIPASSEKLYMKIACTI